MKNKIILRLLLFFIISFTLLFITDTNASYCASNYLDYTIKPKDSTVILDGENDGSVTVDLITNIGGTFYAFQGNFSTTNINTSRQYLNIQSFKDPNNANESYKWERNITNGRIIYAEITNNPTGFLINKQEAIWSAVYKIDKNTPLGTYTVSLSNISIDNSNDEFDLDGYEGLETSIKVTRKVKIEVSGYSTNYTYTGNSIKPINLTISTKDTNIKLVENRDYTISYGTNKNIGTGTITIKSVSGSDYPFDTVTKEFTIDPYELSENEVIVPNSIAYTGNTLTPSVSVIVNDKKLTMNTDYTVQYDNQNGNIGEDIKITVNGIGNYSTLTPITKLVSIKRKPEQTLTFTESNVVKEYSTTKFIITAVHSAGDGEILYSSSNTDVANVDNKTGEVTIKNIGETNITASASETDNYDSTETSYKLVINPKIISISNVEIKNKYYDETKSAVVSKVIFNDETATSSLVLGQDYITSAIFESANAGKNKKVNGTIVLKDNVKKYKLDAQEFTTTAEIYCIEIENNDVTIQYENTIYDGTEKEPNVTVTKNGKELTINKDYILKYSDNINAGNGKVYVEGKGNYSTIFPIVKTFKIERKVVSPSVLDIEDVVYNCEAQHPDITVVLEDKILIPNVDYITKFEKNVDVGIATVEISSNPNGNYSFESISKTFKIDPYEIKEDDISLSSLKFVYDGTEKKPEIEVTVNGVIVPSDDYTVEYLDNIEKSEKAKVIITITGNNFKKAKITKYFEISDKEVLKISGIENNQKIADVDSDGNITLTDASEIINIIKQN